MAGYDELQALNARVIADIEGMPWSDNYMTKIQLKESVKYFIKAYTNDVTKLIEEKE